MYVITFFDLKKKPVPKQMLYLQLTLFQIRSIDNQKSVIFFFYIFEFKLKISIHKLKASVVQLARDYNS